MRLLAAILFVTLTACSSSGQSNAKACDALRAHRTAIHAQMDAVNGNDDASIAAYNALVARSNKDDAALKALGCSAV